MLLDLDLAGVTNVYVAGCRRASSASHLMEDDDFPLFGGTSVILFDCLSFMSKEIQLRVLHGSDLVVVSMAQHTTKVPP